MRQPLVSVVIPTYARPGKLRRCLQSLVHLDYPQDCLEVIVVDDGSQDPFDAVVASFARHLDVRMIVQSHAGPATARNSGAVEARGEILAFTDDDCTPHSGWLCALISELDRAPGCLVGGRTINGLVDNACSTASQLLISYLYAYYNADPDNAFFFASNNLALPTECFHAIGGFDPSYSQAAGEDRDLCDRWLQAGYRMVYVPNAIVYHAHHLNLSSFWRQHKTYGRGAFRFRQARAHRGQEEVRIEPVRFYLDLLRFPFSNAEVSKKPLVVALLVVSQVANAVGFMLERRETR